MTACAVATWIWLAMLLVLLCVRVLVCIIKMAVRNERNVKPAGKASGSNSSGSG